MICAFVTDIPPTPGGPPPSYPAPVAGWTVSNFFPSVGDTIYFSDTSSNGPTSWNWYINGMLFSNDPNPQYYCQAGGFFTVELDVSNAFGSDSHTDSIFIFAPVGEVGS